MFLTVIAFLGITGIVAQVVLLRELLVGFYGNEMTVGVALANWLAGEALGAYWAGSFVRKLKNTPAFFLIFQLLFLVSIPVCLYFARVYKIYLGIPVGAGIGFSTIAWVTLVVCGVVSFFHGALFSLACGARASVGMGKIYAWETIGAIAGGVFLTYALLPFLNSFDVVFVVIALNLAALSLYLSSGSARCRGARNLALLGLMLVAVLSQSGILTWFQERSIRSQFRQGTLLAYRNSVYGNVAVTGTEGQFTFFSNGLPVIATPVGDISFVEDFGNIPLAFSTSPSRVFVAGGGLGGLLNEVLKHPVSTVDYAQIDPLVVDMVRGFKTPLTESELSDARLRILARDPRYALLRAPARSYDIILVGVSHPSDLASNRLFTSEFFSAARSRLGDQGIIALWMPGSLSYLSEELGLLNAGVLNSLHDSFPYIRVIPGDYNIYVASASSEIMRLGPALLASRLEQRGVQTQVISLPYLENRMNPDYLEWFVKNISIDETVRNSDLRPVTVFHTLMLWNKQFSPWLFPALKFLGSNPFVLFLVGILLVWGLPSFFPRRQTARQKAVSGAIATTGFAGMMANLLLIFSYQVACGYVYHRIGMLIAILMAGTAFGSMAMSRFIAARRLSARPLVFLEIAGIIFSGVLMIVVTRLTDSALAPWLFGLCFFFCGALIGLAFPLGGALYLKEGSQPSQTAGSLYFADLYGGWVAGMLCGFAGVALIGVQGACGMMAFIKTGSCAALLIAYRTKDS